MLWCATHFPALDQQRQLRYVVSDDKDCLPADAQSVFPVDESLSEEDVVGLLQTSGFAWCLNTLRGLREGPAKEA